MKTGNKRTTTTPREDTGGERSWVCKESTMARQFMLNHGPK
ncbi:hypothetical protein LEMLEM_LOCUS8848 [Lemmus lemmus]